MTTQIPSAPPNTISAANQILLDNAYTTSPASTHHQLHPLVHRAIHLHHAKHALSQALVVCNQVESSLFARLQSHCWDKETKSPEYCQRLKSSKPKDLKKDGKAFEDHGAKQATLHALLSSQIRGWEVVRSILGQLSLLREHQLDAVMEIVRAWSTERLCHAEDIEDKVNNAVGLGVYETEADWALVWQVMNLAEAPETVVFGLAPFLASPSLPAVEEHAERIAALALHDAAACTPPPEASVTADPTKNPADRMRKHLKWHQGTRPKFASKACILPTPPTSPLLESEVQCLGGCCTQPTRPAHKYAAAWYGAIGTKRDKAARWMPSR